MAREALEFVDGQVSEPELDADQEREYDRFRADATGADAGNVVWVFKLPEEKDGTASLRSKGEFMFSEPIDKYSMDDLCKIVRDEWMREGIDTRWHIRVQIRDPKGSLRMNKLMGIRKKVTVEPVNKVSSQLAETLAAIERMTKESRAENRELLNRLLENRSAAPVQQPLSTHDLLQFMTSQQANAQVQVTNQMASLAAMLTALRPGGAGGSPSSDIGSLFTAMKQARDFAEDMVPTVPRESNDLVGILKAVSPFAPVIAELMKGRATGAPQLSGPVVQPQPNPVPVAVASAEAPVVRPAGPPDLKVVPNAEPLGTVAEQTEMIQELRKQLGALAEIAGEKPDPKAVTANLMPLLPEKMDNVIFTTLSGEDWFEQLSLLQPAIKPHKEWFTQLRAEMLACYAPEDKAP